MTYIGMVVDDRRKGSDGSWVDEVTYVTVTVFGRTAEVASEYLAKGSPLMVEGKLRL